MGPYSGELWNYHLMPTYIEIDFLLPTGILIVLRCRREATLEQVKSELWADAKGYPLYHLLLSPKNYIFTSVTLDSKLEEFYDESRRLCDLKLFHPMLKVVEAEGNRQEMVFNSEIGQAMGISVNEMDDIKQLEVVTFRRRILDVCSAALDQRNQNLPLYHFPPNLESSLDPPEHVKQVLLNNSNVIKICVWVVPQEPTAAASAAAAASANGGKGRSSNKRIITASPDWTPQQAIYEVIRKKLVPEGLEEDVMQNSCDKYKSDFVLRVCGVEDYLLDDNSPLIQYKYIRNCVLEGKVPHLMLVSKDTLERLVVEPKFTKPVYYRKGIVALEDSLKMPKEKLWEFEGPFRVKILLAQYIAVSESGDLFVRAGIYHGMDMLGSAKDTRSTDSGRPKWDEVLDFEIQLSDLPRAAKLCLGLCFSPKKKSRKQQSSVTVLCWGNINLFDFLNRLQDSKRKILMVQATTFEPLNPLVKRAHSSNEPGIPALDIEFERFKYIVAYPDDSVVDFYRDEAGKSISIPEEPSESLLAQISEIASRDTLAELAEQEKELLWQNRFHCRAISHSLPKLLNSLYWGNRRSILEVYWLLARWPMLEPEVAMQLLDCTYPDARVRQFAVQCLEKTLDYNRMSLYLLQLVQVLKFEPYIDNPLTRFLLSKALLNKNIGHFFFWHLKSEMHTTERRRFGLILEAYCRACGSYLHSLIRQVDALDKLTKLTDQLKGEREDDQKKVLMEQMEQLDYVEALQHLHSPLDCSHVLGKLITSDCKIMKSKKKPLKLSWKNDALFAEYYQSQFKTIFKNGDDLRQDMLTLQVIRIMDSIWQSEGMDLRMLPYNVLATGHMVGLIQVVQNAETVMHIQKSNLANAMQLSSDQLHKWLKENNDPADYDRIIENFTMSCVGYSVATYVLGIGDRHPDNIMVTTDGKLFHVDFGHFLNHKKKKFGVNRERVPFVLTGDLICAIAKGKEAKELSREFRRFQELCGKAFLCLRKHSSLLCTLFSMMLNSGIPELQTPNDIGYLRKTLGVETNDQVAVESFQTKFSEAYQGIWTKKVDWFFHWLKNKKS